MNKIYFPVGHIMCIFQNNQTIILILTNTKSCIFYIFLACLFYCFQHIAILISDCSEVCIQCVMQNTNRLSS